jgi:hypothetical protein
MCNQNKFENDARGVNYIYSSHNEGHPHFFSCLYICMCCNIDPRGPMECMLIMVTIK